MRGIGVAVITSTSGASPLLDSASRWCTPKRCCSSTTTRPSLAKDTPAWNSACVPMAICAFPAAIRSTASARSGARSLPVRSTTSMPAASASGAMVEKCWRARSSVGAISAACPPASAMCAIAMRATIVLPEPTSPCSRRSMRFSPARSRAISSSACRCDGVRLKGRAPSMRLASRPSARQAVPRPRLRLPRTSISASWLATSSSKASRCQAGAGRPGRLDVMRLVDGRQRLGKARPALRGKQVRRKPFRQRRSSLQRRRHGPPHHLRREARR